MYIIKLRELLTERLKTAAVGVYYQQAPPKAALPYAVYNLEFEEDQDRQDVGLDVVIWHNNSNTAAAEGLADAIDGAINRLDYSSNSLQVNAFRDGVWRHGTIDTRDPSVKGIKLNYILQVYFKP